MKKIVLMATLFVAALTANAQARFEPGSLTMQPKLGGTGAYFTNTPKLTGYGDKDIDTTPVGGSLIGLDFEYYLTERLGLSAGVGLMQAGTGWKNFDVNEGGTKTSVKDMKIQTMYCNIPVTINWYVANGLALKTGVQAAFLTKADLKMKIDGQKLKDGCKDGFKKFDLSIPIGLSYEFNVPIVIDARYNIGLTKLIKDPDPDEKNCRNLTFMISVGYKFQM